ncbi:MAG: CPBP family intramembrane metalloprotease [Oscillospiraceae bacterium]|nr:CPBP family intramembrane metalloprotease [Oscillospiraceae bacterium]
MDTLTQNSVKPSKEEMKELRRYYSKMALILIVLIGVFSGVNTLVMRISCGIIGGGFDADSLAAGREAVKADPVMSAMYSYMFPLAGDIAALLVGLAVTKIDLKKLFTVKGFDGKDIFNMMAFGFGLPVIASFLMVAITTLAETAMGRETEADDLVRILSANGPFWLKIFTYAYMCVLGPIMEELIFRGVLLAGLRKYGNVFAVVMSSVMFGLAHMSFVQCLPAMTVGFVCAVMVIRTGSILPSMFLHIVNNSVSAILMIMMQGVDLQKMMDASASYDMDAMMSMFSSLLPILIFLMINGFIRLAALVYSLIRAFIFRSRRGTLFGHSDWCTARTWKPCFTSIPMLFILGYLLVETVLTIVQ